MLKCGSAPLLVLVGIGSPVRPAAAPPTADSS